LPLPESVVFLVLAGVFVLAAGAARLPIGISLVVAAIAGALAGGQGIPVRHLVEGSFGYFDVILIILSAILFMKVLQASGALDSLAAFLLKVFYRQRALLLYTTTVLVMLPGMITGSSTVAVLTAGPLVAPVLMKLGLSRVKTGALIAMAAILGMVAPPINILVMIMGGGVDMPYVGVTVPLLLSSRRRRSSSRSGSDCVTSAWSTTSSWSRSCRYPTSRATAGSCTHRSPSCSASCSASRCSSGSCLTSASPAYS
jgi:gluconate:H+ symporter, GntP family